MASVDPFVNKAGAYYQPRKKNQYILKELRLLHTQLGEGTPCASDLDRQIVALSQRGSSV
jgi:hypothetical protein